MKYRFPIDTKSLYLNIMNDNVAGHTATVATPLKQWNSYREDLGKIMEVPTNISRNSLEEFVSRIQEKSRAEAKIIKVCVFDKIAVNGELIHAKSSFCIYVREEISLSNVHCGRQKVHYPSSLKFENEDVNVNNKDVLLAVSEKLNHYAFVVDAFEYDDDSGVLNFDVTIVGPNSIPYSKVFVNRRGTGEKYLKVFAEPVDCYDTEIVALREKLGYDNVNPENFFSVMQSNKAISIEKVKDFLENTGVEDIRVVTEEYPYSIYDLEYKVCGRKRFAIIRNTATNLKKFVLSVEKINFLRDFSSHSELVLVTNVLGGENVSVYSAENVSDMSKQIVSILYDASEF